MEVTKQEVEDLLKKKISDELFEKSLVYAKKKQESSYKREQRPVILQHWYLVQLAAECVRSFQFSQFTMDLCEMRSNIEKELLVKDRRTPNQQLYCTT